MATNVTPLMRNMTCEELVKYLHETEPELAGLIETTIELEINQQVEAFFDNHEDRLVDSEFWRSACLALECQLTMHERILHEFLKASPAPVTISDSDVDNMSVEEWGDFESVVLERLEYHRDV